MTIAFGPTLLGLSQPATIALVTVIALGLVALLTVVIASSRRSKRRRAARWADAIDELGLEHEEKGEIELCQGLGALPGIPKSGQIRHVIRGRLPDPRDAHAPPLTLLGMQHQYTVHTGHAPVTVSHTVYATNAPAAWPELTISPRSGLGRWLGRLGWKRGHDLANEELLRTFRVTGDETFAITLLGPDMQSFLLEHRKLAWCVRPPNVVMVYSGVMRPDRIGTSIDRMRRFWALVPEEMHAWVASAPDDGFAPPEPSPYPPGPS